MTDSRWFERLSATGTLRFLPLAQARATDMKRIHGTDERAGVEHFRGALCTARRVMQLFAGPEGASAEAAGARGAGGAAAAPGAAGAAANGTGACAAAGHAEL
jgi:hypothetical protein